MNKIRTRVDAEMGLLGPVPKNLYSEDWSKNTYNDNRMFRADGGSDEWNNASGARSCRNTCESLFPDLKDRQLLMRCHATCQSKCGTLSCHGYTPTKSAICLNSGRNADCSVKVNQTAEQIAADKNAALLTSKGGTTTPTGTTNKMSTPVKMVIGVVLVGAVIGTIWYIRKAKK